jgi:PAS domain S-box-containing protein
VTIQDGLLSLVPVTTVPDRRTPVDRLLQSLATAYGARAAAVILSGGGSDGALGLKAVSDAGGVTFAQEPSTAQHDGMPQSAIGTGAVDHVLPAEALATELVTYAAHVAAVSERADGALEREAQELLPAICDVLLATSGHNFRHYKTSTLVRRILRRTQVLRLPSATAYLERVRTNAAEACQLFNDLLINVTAFFRDPEAFATLSREVLPNLFRGRPPDQPVRIWCAGCASGEEAYTLAILVREYLDTVTGPQPEVQIFATDIDLDALAVARSGRYPVGVAEEIGAERLRRFFVKQGQHYHVTKELRELVLFSVHNLINDPPFSKLDLISCRNLLIYLGTHLQKKLIPLFHYALKPGGYLFLGPSENLSSHRELFRPVDAKHRLSQRMPTAIRPPGVLSGRGGSHTSVRSPSSPLSSDYDTYLLMQRIILDEFAPKAVIVNEDGQIVSASGNLEKYLTVSAGAFQNRITRLVREGLRTALRSALAQAVESRRKAVKDALSLHTEHGVQRVMLTVQPMPQVGEDAGLFLVVFQDVGLPTLREGSPREAASSEPLSEDAPELVEQLERDLATAREELERTVQDLEAANEELKSGNEELLSMNEELQSANEELETSKEDVQTANETLARLNTDLENLLTSTQIATLFLDAEGVIRRITPAASQIYRLRADDVGRPLSDFTHRARDMAALPAFAEVRRATRPIEHEVELEDGRCFLRRALPYKNRDGEAEGVVVTFTDVTAQKLATEALRLSEERERRRAAELQTVLDAVPALVWTTYTKDAREIHGNRAAAEFLRIPPGRNQSKSAPAGDAPTHFEVIHEGRVLTPEELPVQRAARGDEVHGFEEELVFSDGTRAHLLGNASALRNERGEAYGSVAAFMDITDRRRAQEDLRESERRFRVMADNCPLPIWVAGPNGDVQFVNRAYRAFFGGETNPAQPPNWHSLVHPEDASAYAAEIKSVARTGTPLSQRVRVQRADGEWRWFEAYVSPRITEADQTSGSVGIGLDVTERVQAELDLRRSEEHYRFTVELNPQIPWVADPRGNITDFSARWLTLTGLSREEALGSGWTNVAHPEDMPEMQRVWRQSLETGTPYDFEHRVRLADGSYRWMRSRASARMTPGDQVICWYGTTEDIHERVSAERALRETTGILNAILETTRALVAVKDRESRMLVCNPAVLELVGRSREEVIGKNEIEYLNPKDGAPIMENDRRIMAQNRSETVLEWASGRLFHMTKSPRRDEHGNVIGVIAVGTDMTDLVHAEQALRASEERLRFVMDSMPQKAFTTNAGGVLDYLSPLWAEYCGAPAERIQEVGWLEFIHPDDAGVYEQAWREALRDGVTFQAEHRLRRTDGEYRWHLSRALPMREEGSDTVSSWIGSSTDIHDLKSAEERLRQQNQRKDEFLATLAHELRNPLAPLQNGVSILKHGRMPDRVPQLLGMLERQLGHLVHLVDDLLDVSRVTSGKIVLRSSRVTLSAVIEAAVETCRGGLDAAGHELTIDLPAQPVPLQGDTTRLVQVFTNLLGNACKYTPDSGHLAIRARVEGSGVTIAVADDGTGIPSEMLPQVFEVFTQVKSSVHRSQGGLGLGLALVKRLTEMHGGSCWAESAGLGAGSTFFVRLPLATSEPEARKAEDSVPAPRATHRVLVVDDNGDAADTLAILLELGGHAVRTVYTGTEALALISEFQPTAAILDIGLPDMTGYELAALLKRQHPHVALAALTGFVSEQDRTLARHAGFDAHMAKPVDFERLESFLAGIL